MISKMHIFNIGKDVFSLRLIKIKFKFYNWILILLVRFYLIIFDLDYKEDYVG